MSGVRASSTITIFPVYLCFNLYIGWVAPSLRIMSKKRTRKKSSGKRGRGRPPLAPEVRKDEANTVSMTKADREELEAAMDLVPGGEASLTNFIRRGALFYARHLRGEQEKLDAVVSAVEQMSKKLDSLRSTVGKMQLDHDELFDAVDRFFLRERETANDDTVEVAPKSRRKRS